MKVAICLHGLSSGSNDKGDMVSFDDGISSLKEHVSAHYDVDFFFHTWSGSSTDSLINEYNPTNYMIDNQIEFDGGDKSKKHSVYSRWYSFSKSIDALVESRKKYDFVLSCRFDMVFYNKFLKFENLNNDNFFITNWWQNYCNYGYNDPWFVCNQENMVKMSTIYKNLDSYLEDGSDYEKYVLSLNEVSPGEKPENKHKLSSHSLLRWHVHQTQKQTEYVGLEYETWSLIRKQGIRKNPHYTDISFATDVPVVEVE